MPTNNITSATDSMNEEFKQKLTENQQQLENAYGEYNTIGDYMVKTAEELRAAKETPEQREKRVKAEKATAAMAGAIEGIGSIFNLVHASKNKNAVAMQTGVPVTEQIDNAIKQGAVQREAADEKLRAYEDKLNNIMMARANAKIQQLRMNREDLYKQQSEQRAADLHPYQKQTAENQATITGHQATAAQHQAATAEEQAKQAKFSTDHQEEMFGKQIEAQDAATAYRNANAAHTRETTRGQKMENDLYEKDPELLRLKAGGAAVRSYDKTRVNHPFSITINGETKNFKSDLDITDIKAIIDNNPTLKSKVEKSIDDKEGVQRRGNKVSRKRTLTEKERSDEYVSAFKNALLETYESNPDFFDKVIKFSDPDFMVVNIPNQNNSGSAGGNLPNTWQTGN